MDPYVIDSPWFVRKIVVSGFILPFRPKRTAHAYQRIWEPTGSPLLRHVRGVSRRARRRVSRCRSNWRCVMASRRSQRRRKAARAGVDEILLIAMYPHHADSTRTTTIEAVERELARQNANVRLDVRCRRSTTSRVTSTRSPHSIDRAIAARFAAAAVQLSRSCRSGIITRADPTGGHCLKSRGLLRARVARRTRRAIATRYSRRRAALPRGWG